MFFHYATGVDLEFTLRSADVVEKQDGPTAWIKSVRWIRGYIIQSKGWARTNGLYTSFFLSPLGWVTLEFIANFLGGLILMPKNVFFSLEVSLCHRGASGTKSRSRNNKLTCSKFIPNPTSCFFSDDPTSADEIQTAKSIFCF